MTMSQAGFTCGVSTRWTTIRACRRRAAGALSRSDSRQRCSSSSSVARVVSVTSAEFGARARRPAYSVLAHAKLAVLGEDDLRPWDAALAAYVAERAPSA